MKLTLNVPTGERLVRVVLGLAVAIAAGVWAFSGEVLWGTVVVASGLGFAVTGVVGWCPLCHMVGRTLPKTDRVVPVAKL